MKSGSNLIQIVGSSHSPLPVIVLKYVITISKLAWVSFGLSWFESMGTSDSGLVIDMIRVLALRWVESLVIETWVSGSSSAGWSFSSSSGAGECSHWHADECSLSILYQGEMIREFDSF